MKLNSLIDQLHGIDSQLRQIACDSSKIVKQLAADQTPSDTASELAATWLRQLAGEKLESFAEKLRDAQNLTEIIAMLSAANLLSSEDDQPSSRQ